MNRFGDAPVGSAPSPESEKPKVNRFGDLPVGQQTTGIPSAPPSASQVENDRLADQFGLMTPTTSGKGFVETPAVGKRSRFGDPVADTSASLPTDQMAYPSRPDLQAQADDRARTLAAGDIATREKGMELVPQQNADGTTTYAPTQTNPTAPLSDSEKLAIYQAQAAQQAGRPIGGVDAGRAQTVDELNRAGGLPSQLTNTPELEQMEAQVRGVTALQNSPLENFSGAVARLAQAPGRGWLTAVKPELGAALGNNENLVVNPDTKAAFAGSIVGNMLPMIPALIGGPAGTANVIAGLQGLSQFGAVREDVANRRRAKREQISIGQELSAAAWNAISEFAGERIGIGAFTGEGKRLLINSVANRVLQYANAISVNATEELATQIAQNMVNRAFVDEKQNLDEGVSDAALLGAGVGAVGGAVHQLHMHQQQQRANINAAQARRPTAPQPAIAAPQSDVSAPTPTVTPPNAAPVSGAGAINTAAPEPVRGPTSLETAKAKFRVQEGAESKGVEVQFDDPVEKALYIASQPRKGKLQREAVKFLEAQGYGSKAIEMYGDEVQARVAEAAKGSADGVLRISSASANTSTQAVPASQPDSVSQGSAFVDAAVKPQPEASNAVQASGSASQIGETVSRPVTPAPVEGVMDAKPLGGTAAPGNVVRDVVSEGVGSDSTEGRATGAVQPSASVGSQQSALKPTTFLPSPQQEQQAVNAATQEVKGFRREMPQNRDMAEAGKVFAKRGVRVVFFSGESRGFRMKRHPGLIFVNVNEPTEGFKEAISHELAHELHDTRPGLYQEFADTLTPEERAEWEDKYTRAFEKMRPGQKPSHLDEEGVAMPFGKLAMNHSRVWAAAMGRNPTLAQKIMDFFREFAAKFHGKSRQINAAIKAFEATLQTPIAAPSTPVAEQRVAALPNTNRVGRYGGSDASFLPNDTVRDEAAEYAKQAGINLAPDTTNATVNVERAKQIAQWYEGAKHSANDPAVKASYDAMKRETLAQYEFLKNKGVKFEPWGANAQPYTSSEEMMKDVRDNRHLGFFQGGDLPTDHPLAEKVPGTDLTYNDVFRAVHDYFGHAKEGNGFGPRGEENAWRQHSQMYSAAARPAMAAETRGQNSWVNYGPHGEANRANPKGTQYAEQKAVLMPEQWVSVEREGGPNFLPSFPPKNYPETEYGYWVSPDGKTIKAVPPHGHSDVASAEFGATAKFGVSSVTDALSRGYIRVVASPNADEVSVEISEDADPTAIRPFIAAAIANGKQVQVEVWGSGEYIVLTRQSDMAKLDKLGQETPPTADKPNFLPGVKQLRRGGELPTEVTALNRERVGGIAAEEKTGAFAVKALRRAVKEEFGKSINKLDAKDIEQLDQALKGQLSLFPRKPRVDAAIKDMRDHVDALTARLLTTNLVDPRLATVLGNNIGTYLNRSYRVFDDPEYAKKVPPAAMAAAVHFVEGQLRAQGKPVSLAPTYIDEMLQDWKAGGVDKLLSGGKLGSNKVSILKARQDIAPEIRALMGEYKNPLTNYAKSVSKMASLLSNNQFLGDVATEGAGKWLFTDETAKPGFTTRIAAPGSTAMAPLNGLRTSPEIAQAFADFNKPEVLPAWAQALMAVNYVAKSANTVASLMTHARNMLGQFYFWGLNGHWRIDRAVKASRVAAVDNLWSMGDQALRDYAAKLNRLGVLGDGVLSGEMLADMKDMGLNDLDLGPATLPQSIRNIARKALVETPQKVYAATDAFGKVVGFEHELDRAKAAHPSWSLEQQEKEAAERVTNTYPTYSKIPPAIQKLRRQPFIGPFVAFWYESLRTSGNALIYAGKDLASGNAAAKRAGAARVAGMATVVGLPLAIQAISKALLGMDDEDEEAYRMFQPPWSKGNLFLFLGRDNKGKIQTADLSALNPYSILTDSIHALADGDKPVLDRLTDAAGEFFRPLIDDALFTQALVEAKANKTESGRTIYNPQDDTTEQWKAVLGHLLSSVTPGTYKRLTKRIIPGLKGEELPFGDAINPREEIVAETSGVRVRTFNFDSGLSFAARNMEKNSVDVTGLFLREVGKSGKLDESSVIDAYEKMERRRFGAWQDMYRKAKAAQRMGLSLEDTYSALIRGGVPDGTAVSILSGAYEPYDIANEAVVKAYEKHGDSLPLDKLAKLYEQRASLRLDENPK